MQLLIKRAKRRCRGRQRSKIARPSVVEANVDERSSFVRQKEKKLNLKMEDTDEFAWAVKVVIKRQMRDLMEQLRERGEEVAVMTVNVEDNTCSHFGSPNGEWFISEQKNITKSFLDFCQTNGSGKKKGKQAAGTQKKKSIASLKDSSKHSASNEVPEVRVTVPKNLVGDMTEEEVANLVGRIVATHLAVQEKGDGSSSGTQFDVLVRTANHSKKDTSVPSTPTRSARKRKPTAKYMEGMSTLKKSKRLDDDDAASELGTEDDTNVISLLSELNNTVLRKVQVSINNERNINLEDYDIEASENTEWLAVNIIHELDAISAGQLAHKKSIKVTVCLDIDSTGDKICIELEGDTASKLVKSEDMGDSDMEYLDLEGHDEDDDYASMDNEDNNDPDFPDSSIVKMIAKSKMRASLSSKPPEPLKRKKKQVKPLSERMPMPCEHCGIHLAGKSNLKSHIRRVHLKQKNKKCTICSKGFWSATARESHMLSVHTRRCDKCQEYVVESVPWGAGMDMRMKRDVICTCGAIVSIFSSFGRRRQYLRDDEPDEDGNFPDPPAKQKSHTGTKYACGICGKLFMKKSNCERHSRAHTDYKGIECEICGSQFTYESSLKKHLQTEHGVVSHVCEICGKNYSNETALKVHYVKYHAQENFTIGENVVMIVKEKGGDDSGDLTHQMEEIMEGEADDIVNGGVADVKGHLVVSESGQVVVTHGEGGQVTLTTTDGQPVGDTEAAQIVQQVIHDGQVVAQEGNMSIIIKQIPVTEMENL